MRCIIAGSRHLIMTWTLLAIGASGWTNEITEVVSGGAPGPDSHGELWAQRHHLPVTRFPADWNRYGKSAGPRRNEEMAAYADRAIVVWDGSSPGSAHLIRTMRRIGKPVFVYTV